MKAATMGAALALTLLGADLAVAQQMPQLPPREEIERKVEEELAKLPVLKAESEHLVIEYKEMPTDPISVAKRVAGGQVPAGIDPEIVAKQALPMIRPIIEKYAAKLGTLTAKSDLKYRGKTLAKDQVYDFGLIMDGLRPVGILLSGGDLKRPLKLPLKPARGKHDPVDPMKVEVVPHPRDDGKLYVQVGFAEVLGAAGPFKVK